jgi:hypothetical protein
MCVSTVVLTVAHQIVMTYREQPTSLHPRHDGCIDDYIVAGIHQQA